MNQATISPAFRLVPIGADGAPDDPTLHLGPDDRQACEAMARLYATLGFQPPWLGYVSVDGDVVVGGGAFVGPPVNGQAEIAYYTAPGRQGKGYATLTAQRLVAIARAADPWVRLFAKTEPRANASTAILSRLGFVHTGSTQDEEIGEAWLWSSEGA